ncbi:MAG TPA: 3-dehydroquinate synthase [Pyrinomonadaceae bacterium]|nr:3-dehydroquinate synthase [Pyrinomonadaceae bacterium]
MVRTRCTPAEYRVMIGCDILSMAGEIARDSLPNTATRIHLISNPTVFEIYGKAVETSLRRSRFSVESFLIGDGERFKTFTTLSRILGSLSDNRHERSDGVLALGGGVVGDLAGFASGVYLRGIPFINAPTTLLAQIDASVGGKTGINLAGGKNLVGVFHQPAVVIADLGTLSTLPSRELVSGCYEMIKQAAIANLSLFNRTSNVVKNLRSGKTTVRSSEMQRLVAKHCRFKASIVADDEREGLLKVDTRSRKVLNFGHTFAHALETVTNYRRFRHGEAVGIGMIVAATLSNKMGLLRATEKELLVRTINFCGPLPTTRGIDVNAVLLAIGRDKKTIGGEAHWVLLEQIGVPRIVKASKIPLPLLRRSVKEALATVAKQRSEL